MANVHLALDANLKGMLQRRGETVGFMGDDNDVAGGRTGHGGSAGRKQAEAKRNSDFFHHFNIVQPARAIRHRIVLLPIGTAR